MLDIKHFVLGIPLIPRYLNLYLALFSFKTHELPSSDCILLTNMATVSGVSLKLSEENMQIHNHFHLQCCMRRYDIVKLVSLNQAVQVRRSLMQVIISCATFLDFLVFSLLLRSVVLINMFLE